MMIVFGIVGITAMATPPLSAYAACDQYILTFPAWYNGLTTGTGDACVIQTPTQDKGTDATSLQTFIVKIILNVIDILMQLVAYASVVFLLIGGFRYLTSAGAPDHMTAAKKTITNAIVGLVIGMLAVAIVNLVGASL